MQRNTAGQRWDFSVWWMDNTPYHLAANTITVKRVGDGTLAAVSGTLDKLEDGKFSFSTSAADNNFQNVTFFANAEGAKPIEPGQFQTYVGDAFTLLNDPATGINNLHAKVDLIDAAVDNIEVMAEAQEYVGDAILQGQSHTTGNSPTNIRIFDSSTNYLDGARPNQTANYYRGLTCVISSGVAKGLDREVTASAYTSGSPGWVDLTLETDNPLPVTPDNQCLFYLKPGEGRRRARLASLVTDKLDTAMEADLSVYRFTTNALEQAPTGGGASAAVIADAVWDEARADHTTAGSFGQGVASVQGNVTGSVNDVTTKTGYSLSAAGVQAIWDALTSALTTAGSIGKLLVDNINATISSRSSHAAADIWSVATRTLSAFGFSVTVGTNNDKTGYSLSTTPPTAAQVGTAVRSELATELARVDVAVSTRLATSGYTAPPSAAAVGAQVRTELGTELGRIDAAVSTRATPAQVNTEADQALADAGVTTALTGKLAQHAAAVIPFVVGTGSTPTSVVLSSMDGGAPPASAPLSERVIIFTTGALKYKAQEVSSYAAGAVAVANLGGTPQSGDVGVIV